VKLHRQVLIVVSYSRTSLIQSSKLQTPLLLGHHLVKGLGGKGYHLAHAYSKVATAIILLTMEEN